MNRAWLYDGVTMLMRGTATALERLQYGEHEVPPPAPVPEQARPAGEPDAARRHIVREARGVRHRRAEPQAVELNAYACRVRQRPRAVADDPHVRERRYPPQSRPAYQYPVVRRLPPPPRRAEDVGVRRVEVGLVEHEQPAGPQQLPQPPHDAQRVLEVLDAVREEHGVERLLDGQRQRRVLRRDLPDDESFGAGGGHRAGVRLGAGELPAGPRLQPLERAAVEAADVQHAHA